MPTHVALLRGINVGGRNRVTMADLRRIAAELGHTDAATYIQSGNLVFTSALDDPDRLAASLEAALAAALPVRPRVVVLSCADLARCVAANPYPEEPDPKRVHAMFLSGDPDAEWRADIDAAVAVATDKGGHDRATLVGRTLYLHTPDGYGRSELAVQLSRREGRRGRTVVGTVRNWATVMRLSAMCGS